MGMFKNALKTGLLLKAVDVARQQASKPENQRRAKEFYTKMANKRSAKRGSES